MFTLKISKLEVPERLAVKCLTFQSPTHFTTTNNKQPTVEYP